MRRGRGRPPKNKDKETEKEKEKEKEEKEKENAPSETSPVAELEHSPTESPTPTLTRGQRTSYTRCPACKDDENSKANPVDADKEMWVCCDECKRWHHWRCLGPITNPDSGVTVHIHDIGRWYCADCIAADSRRTITFKLPSRKSTRTRPPRDYARLHAGQVAVSHSNPSNGRARATEGLAAGLAGAGSAEHWGALLREKDAAGAFASAPFKHMQGSELKQEWFDTDAAALLEPVLIEEPEGLGMVMPPPETTVSDIARLVGEDTSVEVLDVSTQAALSGWTLGRWASYFTASPTSPEHQKVLNVISLEISDTPLGAQVVPPSLVRSLDWVTQFWPEAKRGPGHAYPKVQLYCLMGVANAWTDWHIDFAGSSVYYHIHTGAKSFYFIRPTSSNLAAFERWSGSELQTTTWLGDFVDEVYKVELKAGNTMIIPTGWIHAVYTPVDTLVFGGNFLHSYNISTQLRIREIEISTGVAKRNTYPFFTKLSWYAAEAYVRALKAREDFSPRVLSSLSALACYLVAEAHLLEGRELPFNANGHGHGKAATTQARRRDAKEAVPGDRVKDAPALARELRWRVRLAQGGASDGEDDATDEHARGGKRKRATTSGASAVANAINSVSHAQPAAKAGPALTIMTERPKFKNFVPKRWDTCGTRNEQRTRVQRRAPMSKRPPPPNEGPSVVDGPMLEWAQPWMDDWDDTPPATQAPNGDTSAEMDIDESKESVVPSNGDEVDVETKYEVLVRVRRTPRGLERQRIVRRVEMWEWPETDAPAAGANAQEAEPEDDSVIVDDIKIEGESGAEDIEVVVD